MRQNMEMQFCIDFIGDSFKLAGAYKSPEIFLLNSHLMNLLETCVEILSFQGFILIMIMQKSIEPSITCRIVS